MENETPYKRSPLYLYSRDEGAILFGVCKGISIHLEINVKIVRIIIILLSFSGIGVFLYLWLLTFIPKKPQNVLKISQENSLIQPLNVTDKDRFLINSAEYLSYSILLIFNAVILIVDEKNSVIYSALLMLILGVSLVCFETIKQYRANKINTKTLLSIKYLLGFLITISSMFYIVQSHFSSNMIDVLVISIINIGIFAILLLPIYILLFKSLSRTEYENIKEKEKANIAAHLHDGVLQTLILIQQNSTNPDEIEYLAKTQERDLRAWLYGHRPDEGTSVASIIKENISEIEDKYRKNLDLIVVGDCRPNKQTHSFIGALREASINALIHGELPVSIYVEITLENLEFYVRDRGKGFSLEKIPANRLGVKNSIYKRVENAGGIVRIKNSNGCEINVEIPNTEE